jgi:5-methylcytosine-specific restriction protein B
MQQEISKILEIYPSSRSSSPFKGPHEVQRLFRILKGQVEKLSCVDSNPNLIVKYSYGKGNWAAVPWLAILDSRETTSTQDGTYIVLLFREDGAGAHLKLAQGVTSLKNSLGSRAADELGRRAHNIRELFPEMESSDFDLSGDSRLGAERGISKLYDASTILSKYWDASNIPEDSIIEESISILVDCYRKYIEQRLEEPDQDIDEPLQERRIWAISAGENGKLWDQFLEEGIMAIGWDLLGDLSQYGGQEAITSKLEELFESEHRPTNDSLCCHQFSKEISVGDIVVAKAGRKQILGMGEVTSDYYYDEKRELFKNIRNVNWLRAEPSEFPGSGTTVKTLTEITTYPTFVELVKSYLDIGQSTPHDEEEEEPEQYSIQSILDEGCFLDETELRAILGRLRFKKNLILQGPPGTGKTWLAKRLAYALMGRRDFNRLRSVQFHINLSYEDFVRGWRPTGDGKLALVDGVFMEAIEDARNSSQPYVVVIEEINRGNPAQIFGEMLTLMEADKRAASEALELSYRRHASERVYVPPNLYVIGTMNVADRSLAIVDMALRRRFAFIDMVPKFNQTWRSWLQDEVGLGENFINDIASRVTRLNEVIATEPTLGPQYCIGHSYLTPPADAQISDESLFVCLRITRFFQ